MPQLETRKIVALGGSLVVPLPKGWLRYHHLKKGDEVEIITNRNIIIRTTGREAMKNVRVKKQPSKPAENNG